jgi:adenylate cyclase
MPEAVVQRRLAAIMVADVVGYSRMMGANELATLTALTAHRRDFIDPMIAAYKGRIVKTAGDGLLLEFGSVVDAVLCAIAIQQGMVDRNIGVPEAQRITFRMGVNIGDVIVQDLDLFGDGVNVAARLETLCEPGGICISRAAHEQIRDKINAPFVDIGSHEVKNIVRAVEVFSLGPSILPNLPRTESPNRHVPTWKSIRKRPVPKRPRFTFMDISSSSLRPVLKEKRRRKL